MAKASEIISRLVNIVPTLTDIFSDSLSITSLTNAGGLVTAVTATPHGLTTGNIVNITGAQAPVVITTLTSANGVATATTATPHDLTRAPDEPFTPTIKVTGANQSEYNGIALETINIQNRLNFTYEITGNPVSPATGDLILLFDGRERGYNGRKTITVVNATTFTYPITTTPISPAIGTITVHKNVRISGSVSIERAVEAYSKQIETTVKKLWAFVVLGDTSVNKDRMVYSNAVANVTPGSEYRQREIQAIKVYVVTPCTDQIAARAARDLMEDVKSIFYKCLLRFVPANGLVDTSQFGIAFAGNKIFAYEPPFYVHEFEFEIICDITEGDVLVPENVAFRDVDFTITNSPDELITNQVDLDESPL